MESSSDDDIRELFAPPDLPSDTSMSYRPGRESLPARGPRTPAGFGIGDSPVHPPSTNETALSFETTRRRDLPPMDLPVDDDFDDPPPFRLERLIGRGGFGEVWEGTQTSLGRFVAIKRLRQDLVTDSERGEQDRRHLETLFRQEAVTTSGLEHPNIVPVHDLGRDAEGRPLLAMKMVRGKPWDALIEEDFGKLAVPDFLGRHLPILIDVAQAVAFAHSRGIVHRDLKPGQVMVGEFGEVLLMDWGLAVCFDAGLARPGGGAHVTALAAPDRYRAWNPSGTVCFMAPEQTEDTCDNIGTWTDVYLLGATLYLMLTGAPPHDSPHAAEAFASARAGDVPRADVRANGREVPRELADLCAEAMRPSHRERLSSVPAFIAGLQDYLTGAGKRRESIAIVADVESRLPTAAGDYRAYGELAVALGNARVLWPENPRLVALRERTLAEYAESALARGDLSLARVQAERLEPSHLRSGLLDRIAAAERALIEQRRQRRFALATVVVLLILVAVGGLKHSADQRRARREVEAANDRLEKANRDLRVQRDLGEDVMAFMLGDLTSKLAPAGRLELLRDVADKSLDYYARLPADAESADAPSGRIVALRRLAATMADMGDLPAAGGAIAEARQALAIAGRAGRLAAEWRVEEVELLLLDSRVSRLGGHPTEARAALDDALALASRLAQTEGTERDGARLLAEVHAALAEDNRWRGNLAASTEEATEALAMFDRIGESLRAADMHGQLAANRADTGDLPAALEHFDARRTLAMRLIEQDPSDTRYRFALVQAHRTGGDIHYAGSAYSRALEQYHTALDLLLELERGDPTNALWRTQEAWLRNAIALMNHWQGEFETALNEYSNARDILVELLARDPGNAAWSLQLTTEYNNLGSVLLFLKRPEEARSSFEAMHAILRRLVESDPGNLEFRRQLAMGVGKLAIMAEEEGDLEGALELFQQSEAMDRVVAESEPSNVEYARSHAAKHVHCGIVYGKMGRYEEARQSFELARAESAAILGRDPENPTSRRDVALIEARLGANAQATMQFARADTFFTSAIATVRDLLAQNPDNPNWRMQLAENSAQLARVRAALGHAREALTIVDEAVSGAEALLEGLGDHDGAQGVLVTCLLARAEVRRAAGDDAGAAEDTARAARLDPDGRTKLQGGS